MKQGPIYKYLGKDEDILWNIEDTFTIDRKLSLVKFFLYYFFIIIVFYMVFYIQFIMLETLNLQELLFRNLYFLIFITLFSIFVYLIRNNFPVHINAEYFLTNLRFIYLDYFGAKLGGYRINSFYYPDIISVGIIKNIQEDIFEINISKNVRKGLLFKRNEVFEYEVIVDKKGLEIFTKLLKEKSPSCKINL